MLDFAPDTWYTECVEVNGMVGRFVVQTPSIQHNTLLWAKRPLSGGLASRRSLRQRWQPDKGRFGMGKVCTVCKKRKPIEEFGPRYGKPHARASCRKCDNASQRAYRRRNLEERRRKGREWMAEQRQSPEGRSRQREIARESWRKCGRDRQREYLTQLKQKDFFAWKARKSYVHLSAEQLRQLWEQQQGLCGLTGRPLGEDPELDHIVPRTRGGDNSYENMRWLCADANQAKRALLDDELLMLCRDVIAWSERDR